MNLESIIYMKLYCRLTLFIRYQEHFIPTETNKTLAEMRRAHMTSQLITATQGSPAFKRSKSVYFPCMYNKLKNNWQAMESDLRQYTVIKQNFFNSKQHFEFVREWNELKQNNCTSKNDNLQTNYLRNGVNFVFYICEDMSFRFSVSATRGRCRSPLLAVRITTQPSVGGLCFVSGGSLANEFLSDSSVSRTELRWKF